ncbi:Putative uncharacterized protein [Taphrina deformans PYCC 5710]|uniref:Uncharacterized protein n=1 Tax=Taphrina deformans (strain PYCC 5710 / ATCC 11124 / CBS 356.35 / IMI 108563 / JCM 9778 / NBRC 8474) TaxID=1097556 RepID=R4XIU4_TAPDE|nr:Putative uncharacterized protein [Taphrina deformans PYCC 5710]|eukprot:CCG83288.2 Putative uncharacterized protein [Taphrina deformans PYCC 5710]
MTEIVAICVTDAKANCVVAGGDPKTITITEVTLIPIPFCNNSIRVCVKCVSDLLIGNLSANITQRESTGISERSDLNWSPVAHGFIAPLLPIEGYKDNINIMNYRPHIDANRQWILSELDLKLMALGCYVLGCAGGGSTYTEYLQLRNMSRAGHVFRVAESSALSATDVVLYGGYMGSPAVSVERTSADEFMDATKELLQFLGLTKYSAVMGLEIGGGNGLQAFFAGSSKRLDVPCLDADWMGRAFPTYYQTTLCVHKRGELAPAAISSGDGRAMIMTKASDDKVVDVALRAACSEMGSRVGMAGKPVSGLDVQNYAVMNTVSLAWRIGRVIQHCQQTSSLCHVAEMIIDEVGGSGAAKKLYCGKIISVENKLYKGHNYGSITIEAANEAQDGVPLPFKTDGVLYIPYKNESILAEYENPQGLKTVLATVPDLICVVDANSGEALGVPEFRYGLRVIVLGITASPRWTSTSEGLALGGPSAFGYDIDYQPLGIYETPRSVIEEFAPV